MTTQVKMCGLKTLETIAAAVDAGADYLGFVFFAKSPRSVTPDEAARLSAHYRGKAAIVALTVDAADASVDAINQALRPDFFQLHGNETPQRASEIKANTGAKIIKAISVRSDADVARAHNYLGAADIIMFDAKPMEGQGLGLPGGNGISFDWRLVERIGLPVPYFLSGGLNPDNVADAICLTGAPMVDVSSGIEESPGLKSISKIHSFMAAVRSAGGAHKTTLETRFEHQS